MTPIDDAIREEAPEMNMDNLTVQHAQAEKIEYIDLFIPIVRYQNSNFWSTAGCYSTKEEAVNAIRHYSGIVDAKLLIHSERFVLKASHET